MLSLGGVSAGACGFANPVCAVYRVRPSRAESKHLMSIASFGCIREK